MYDTILIVDQWQRDQETIRRGQKVDPDHEAKALSLLIKPLGRHDRRIAIVSQDDEKGLAAYQRAGFETITINGDRPRKLRQFISRIDEDIEAQRPRHMVVVTTDPAFDILCSRVVRNKHTDVAVWGHSAGTPPELMDPAYGYRPLEELLPDIKVPRVDVRLDYENLHIGLEQKGCLPDPALLIEAVKTAINDLGEIVNIVAYADWSELSKRSDRDIQRDLACIGVETRYQINMHGKNSADMKIADDVRTLVEKGASAPDAIDVIVLGTRDRDFRPTVETAKARGNRVVVLALRGGLSRELERAASEVRYLDQYLPTESHSERLERHLSEDEDKLADTTIRVQGWLYRQGHIWAYNDKLATIVAPGPMGVECIRQAIDAGVLVRTQQTTSNAKARQGRAEKLMLNPGHPLVQTVRHLLRWAPARIAYCLQEKGMPYVDGRFLARGMQMDATFQRLGVGRDRNDAERWLDLAAQTGVIVKRSQPHPKTPSKLITTWWLPDKTAERTTADDTTANEANTPDPKLSTGMEFAKGRSVTQGIAARQQTTPGAGQKPVQEFKREPSTAAVEASKVRKLLMNSLSDEDVTILAFDHFPAVYKRFAANITRSTKVLMLVEYAEHQGQLPQLLDGVREFAPRRVAEFTPRLAAA